MAKQWFYRLEILYNYRGEVKRFEYVNCTDETVHKLRFTILDEGIKVPISAVQWLIIFPWSINDITVFRQDKFLDWAHSDLTKTVFAGDQNKII